MILFKLIVWAGIPIAIGVAVALVELIIDYFGLGPWRFED